MHVGYRIASLHITGFRGIAQLAFDLPVGAPLYIIGANNAGKSTVVNAMALALRGGGFHTFSPEAFDFFQSADGTSAKEFVIDLRFVRSGGLLPAVQGVGNPIDVHGVRVRGCVEKRGRMTHTHTLFGEDGKSITFSNRTALKGATKERYEGQAVGWGPRYARPDDTVACCPRSG